MNQIDLSVLGNSLTRKILYLFRHAPHGTINGQEGLDVLLTGGAFDQDVSVLFMDDGVYQVVGGQDASGIGGKDYTRGFGALGDFCESLQDNSGVYVEAASLARRGLTTGDLSVPAAVIDGDALIALFEEQQAVMNF